MITDKNMISKITVITVVYNAASRLQETIDSVLGQDHEDIEYIIKDGGSTDGTVDVVKRAIESGQGNIVLLSGKDDGIYDAMNIALKSATGDVVQFLNAGDRFADSDVVSRAMKVMEETGADIVFGDVMYENPDGTTDIRCYPQGCARKVYYLTGDCINHQCMFVRRSLFDGNDFNTSFKICADREWMLRVGAYSSNLKMKALGFTVAVYPLDGASVVNKERYRKEAGICVRRYMPAGYPVYALFEFVRGQKRLADVLHKLYKKLYFG